MAQLAPRADAEPWDRRDVLPVVTLLCSIALLLFATAGPGPGFMKSRSGSAPEKACRANLKQIEGAKTEYAANHRLQPGATLSEGCLWAQGIFMKSEPTCPSGGKYAVSALGESPTCSVGGSHSLD